MLCDLHPELLAGLRTRWLVSVVPRHVSVVDLERLLDGLRVGIHHAIENDLSFLNHVDVRAVITSMLQLLSLQLFNLALANVDRVVDFEEDGLALLLVRFFFLQALDQVIKVIAMDIEVKGHIVHSLSCGALDLYAILGEEVTSLLVRPVRNLVHSRDQRFKGDVAESVSSESLKSFLRFIFEENGRIDFHLLAPNFLVFYKLHVLEGLLVLVVVQVVNDQLFVAACCLRELDTLLDFTMSLKKIKDSQVVDIVFILLQELVELLLDGLEFFFSDHAHSRIVSHDVAFALSDLGQAQFCDPGADNKALGAPLIFKLGHIFLHLSALLLGRRFSLRDLLELL